MNTLAKLIISGLLSLLMMSCNFDFNIGTGIAGNGNVTNEERTISESFTTIEASRGLDVYITQGSDYTITVEADENLHDIIVTEVENGTLIITTTENIRSSTSQKILVNVKNLERVEASSGSDVYTENTLKSNTLRIEASSGADINIDVDVQNLTCHASSGSDINIKGKTINLNAEASSGSDINAKNLMAEYSKVAAHSGADITVNTSKELTANANSGGDVRYYGNPEKVKKSDGVSGSVSRQ